jgi:hypothetical protein
MPEFRKNSTYAKLGMEVYKALHKYVADFLQKNYWEEDQNRNPYEDSSLETFWHKIEVLGQMREFVSDGNPGFVRLLTELIWRVTFYHNQVPLPTS